MVGLSPKAKRFYNVPTPIYMNGSRVIGPIIKYFKFSFWPFSNNAKKCLFRFFLVFESVTIGGQCQELRSEQGAGVCGMEIGWDEEKICSYCRPSIWEPKLGLHRTRLRDINLQPLWVLSPCQSGFFQIQKRRQVGFDPHVIFTSSVRETFLYTNVMYHFRHITVLNMKK